MKKILILLIPFILVACAPKCEEKALDHLYTFRATVHFYGSKDSKEITIKGYGENSDFGNYYPFYTFRSNSSSRNEGKCLNWTWVECRADGKLEKRSRLIGCGIRSMHVKEWFRKDTNKKEKKK